MRRCPTEAIRIRKEKAFIIEERCIDCGECIRICPNHAKYAVSDPLESLKKYSYKIAIPAPSITGQFPERLELAGILGGLIEIGFDDVFEVAVGAEIISNYTQKYIEEHKDIRPLISSACPSVVRLVQVKFPSLVGNIIPLITPMDITAKIARREAMKKTGLSENKIGVFFITPCPAKVTSVKEPVGEEVSPVDGVISISDIYENLINHLDSIKKRGDLVKSGKRGLRWGREGGENDSIKGKIRKLSVDEIHNVIKVLEKVEDGKMEMFDYIEAQACPGGCVGGIFNKENPFVAKERIDRLASMIEEESEESKVLVNDVKDRELVLSQSITPRPITLDPDINVALDKLEKLNEIEKKLPGIDCGACGCPTCKAFAEDIVQGVKSIDDCIVILKEEYKKEKERL
ncbi:MAG: Fe-S cluster domain protein [candidate division TA06 bacterium 32_111]|uniref:Fe-S cluster domain protein n=2 Tax=Bacteria candidate phyla TaxID=1783234 RepID=A0A101I0L4_UNCT6|nr:MAG: Fe-S cluster domain protein [candidate division TA06 bacterium 32_111]KUK86538.1 MAG: Fe-S cluster domain protein [candidate division TA06 bacterium 34_109]HAF07887.1 ferredoxin [candidate division WOR-3 bacterium]HCP16411.1 ferredoxin [candidate division WOR-3 bacterium]